jgi:hypothetical protein
LKLPTSNASKMSRLETALDTYVFKGRNRPVSCDVITLGLWSHDFVDDHMTLLTDM